MTTTSHPLDSSGRAEARPSAPRIFGPVAPWQAPPVDWATAPAQGGVQSGAALLRQAGVGLGLCATYGIALGCRQGGLALLEHAVGVPLGVLLAVLVGGPSMYVFLSLCRAPLGARALATIAARGIGSAGVLLAGLAPAAALFVVSSETLGAARGAVTLGLILGGGVSLMGMLWHVLTVALSGSAKSQLGGLSIALGFAVFAITLATRVWGALLPVLGGAA